jgi:hypothetical protein
VNLHKIYISAIGSIVLAAGFFAVRYEIRIARAEEQQKAADKFIAQKDQEMADRDKANQAKFDALALQIATLATQKQAVTVLTPTVGQIAPTQVSKGDLAPDVQKTLPGDPVTKYTLFTDDQMVKLAKRELACQQTEGNLSTCEADKQTMQAKIDALTKANNNWKKAGSVGPWIAGLGAAKNADGKGYTPTMLFGRRLGSRIGVMGGVQGRGDLSLWLTYNFGEAR